MSQQHTPITWEWLKIAVPLLVVLTSITISAAGLKFQANYLDARLCAIEESRRADTERLRAVELTQAEVQRAIDVRLAEIQRDIAYIRVELGDRNDATR